MDIVIGMLVADEAGAGTVTVVEGGPEAGAEEAGAEAGGQGAGRAGDPKGAGAGTAGSCRRCASNRTGPPGRFIPKPYA